MIPLTIKEIKSYHSKKFVLYARNDLVLTMTIKWHKVRDHCHYIGKCRGASHDICNLRYKIAKEIPVLFYNGSCDYHFIIKELVEESEGQFECLGQNTKKIYNFFSTNLEKTW